MSTSGNYTRTPNRNTTGFRDSGPYEAIVVNNLDTKYMGGLVVELLRYTSSGGTPERSGQQLNVKYLSPFYGITPNAGVTANDGYEHTQKSYGMWMVPPDVGTKVLVIFAEGNTNHGYWIGCIPANNMNFMLPDGRASTENTTSQTPSPLRGKKLPVGEYNKAIETGARVDPTLFAKPYNKDFSETLEIQGLLKDEARGTTTSSARREIPSMVFGVSTPGPKDRRDGSPTVEVGARDGKITIPSNRLGGSSFVMDDGDENFVRATHAEDGPPIYKNKGANEEGGDRTIPQNELIRLRTRTGHQILMHNSEDLIYIGNSRGTTWIEMTSDGKIDIHAQDSVSIMTENDLNITAERDINMEAGRNINLKAAGRSSKGETGRVQIEAKNDYNLHVGRNSKITVMKNQHIAVKEAQYIDTTKSLHIKTGQDNRLTATGNTFINSGKEHRETATYIHMNGPNAPVANPAKTVDPLSVHTLPRVKPGGLISGYETILTRSPQHEPWPHHENLDPIIFKKGETDRDAPGSLQTADRVLTPDTFFKNTPGYRTSSAYEAGSGGNVSTGNISRGAGNGQTPVPPAEYSSDFDFSPELGSLSARYESRGNPATIGWDSTGGWSYGTYQLAANRGVMDEFHQWLRVSNRDLESQLREAGGASAARAGTDAYKAAWAQVMGTAQGAEAQHDYAVLKYFTPGSNAIKRETGLDVTLRSKTVQDVVWSTAIQHGATGAKNIFKRALSTLNYPPTEITPTQPTDGALVRAVYAERRANNGSKYFGSSTAAVRSSVVNRFHNEEADALRSLQQEVEAAQQNPPTIEPTDNTAAVPIVTPTSGPQ